MKLNTATEHTSTITGESETFSIAANGKAFKILLDKLYTNKIRAVVRELWSNAFDAHIAAGAADMPFDCHLPSNLDPTFRVRDYGTSLTHEQVMKLYTTVFESTKDDSDDFVGALGLGSKSPFAITDQFTVTAYLDGEKRTYLAALRGDGVPTITHLGTVASPAAQGFEVSFPCNPSDIGEFQREAINLAVGFDPVPDVDGVQIEQKKPEYVADDASFAIFDNVDTGGSRWHNRISVRQGCVIYPVDAPLLTSALTNLLNSNTHVVLNVPIGSVQIAASREALSMDEQTKEYLREAAEAAAEKLKATITDKADACKTELEALEFWFNGGADHGSLFTIEPEWKGKRLYANIRVDEDDKWPTDPVLMRQPRKKGAGFEIKGLNYVGFGSTRFVVIDTKNPVVRTAARINEYNDSHPGNVYILTDPPAAVFEVLERRLGLDRVTQVIKVADLEDPGPPERVARSRANGELSGVTDVTNGLGRVPVKLTQLPAKYLWFEVERTTNSMVDHVVRQYNLCVQGGATKLPVLTFTAGARKRFKPDPAYNLRELSPLWIEQNRKRMFDALADEAHRTVLVRANLGDLFTGNVDESLVSTARNMLNYVERQRAEERGTRRIDALKKKYPLLFDRHDKKAITDYVAMCDAKEKEANHP